MSFVVNAVLCRVTWYFPKAQLLSDCNYGRISAFTGGGVENCNHVDSGSFLKTCAKHGIKTQEATVKHILIYLMIFEEILVEQ